MLARYSCQNTNHIGASVLDLIGQAAEAIGIFRFDLGGYYFKSSGGLSVIQQFNGL